jgi:hypothetical protein
MYHLLKDCFDYCWCLMANCLYHTNRFPTRSFECHHFNNSALCDRMNVVLNSILGCEGVGVGVGVRVWVKTRLAHPHLYPEKIRARTWRNSEKDPLSPYDILQTGIIRFRNWIFRSFHKEWTGLRLGFFRFQQFLPTHKKVRNGRGVEESNFKTLVLRIKSSRPLVCPNNV